jgi:hypothetical protein
VRCWQVIQLHNAFLSAALERSLLMQAEVVQHIHNLLAAAKELSKVVESCDVQQSGAQRQEVQADFGCLLPD